MGKQRHAAARQHRSEDRLVGDFLAFDKIGQWEGEDWAGAGERYTHRDFEQKYGRGAEDGGHKGAQHRAHGHKHPFSSAQPR